MIKKIFLITALFACFTACKSRSKTALDYNQFIVAKDKGLQPEEQATEDKVTNFYNEGKYDSIAAAGERMEGLLQKAIDEIEAKPLPGVKGGDVFKVAVLQYFKYFRSIYTIYKEFGLADTDEKRAALITEKQKMVAKRDDVVKVLQHAQKSFADANGFRME
jgi:hypothetical protein